MWTIYWLWMMWSSLGAFAIKVRSFPTGSTGEMLVTVLVVFLLLLFSMTSAWVADSMTDPLVSQLRAIAQEPLPERNDPRFKLWKDIRTRFPAPPGKRASYSGDDWLKKQPVRAAGAWFWRPVGRICGLGWGKLQNAVVGRMRK